MRRDLRRLEVVHGDEEVRPGVFIYILSLNLSWVSDFVLERSIWCLDTRFLFTNKNIGTPTTMNNVSMSIDYVNVHLYTCMICTRIIYPMYTHRHNVPLSMHI